MATPERKIEDAHALVPFVFGAFTSKTNRAHFVTRPLHEYLYPEINVKSGKWTLHTRASLAAVIKVAKTQNGSILDILDPVGGVPKLCLVLDQFNEIEKSLVAALNRIKAAAIENSTETRVSILGVLREKSSTDGAQIKDPLRVIIKETSEAEQDHFDRLPFVAPSGLATEEFHEFLEFENFWTLLTKADATYDQTANVAIQDALTNAAAFKHLITQQQTARINTIVATVEAVVGYFKARSDGLKTRGAGLKGALSKEIQDGLLADKIDAACIDQRTIQKELTKFVEWLILERLELFYSNVWTYFSLLGGFDAAANHQLAAPFVQHAAVVCFAPFFKAYYPSDVTSAGSGATNGYRMVQFASKLNDVFHATHKNAIFGTFEPPTSIDKNTIRTQISTQLFGGNAYPYILKSSRLGKLHYESVYTKLTEAVDAFAKTSESTQFQSLIGNNNEGAPYENYKPSYAKDKLRQFVASDAENNIFVKQVYETYRKNPVFASIYIFKESDPGRRRLIAQKYLQSIHSLLALTTLAEGGKAASAEVPTAEAFAFQLEKIQPLPDKKGKKSPHTPPTPRKDAKTPAAKKDTPRKADPKKKK